MSRYSSISRVRLSELIAVLSKYLDEESVRRILEELGLPARHPGCSAHSLNEGRRLEERIEECERRIRTLERAVRSLSELLGERGAIRIRVGEGGE